MSRLTDKFDRNASDFEPQDSEVEFRPAPDPLAFGDVDDRPIWRVQFELVDDPKRRFGLDINGELIFGRDSSGPELVDLVDFGAAELGVSRQHLAIRPTTANLIVIDLGSTNGTLRNGRSIGRKFPSRIANGDLLSLGTLQLRVKIIERPNFHTTMLERKSNLADAMAQIAKAVTSQLDVDDVLNQVAETAMVITSAGETGIWLIDELSGELFLEAERGIDDERIRRLRLPIHDNSLISQVVKNGEIRRVNRQKGEEQIKVKTYYLVESLIYVPIKLADIPIGVLAVVHREQGRKFTARDEQLLEGIADFAAIAIQNARIYQSTDQALQERLRELSALNGLTHAVSATLDPKQVYMVLVEQINKNWDVAAISLYLLDDATNQMILHHAQQRQVGYQSVSLGQGIIGQVAQSGKSFVSNDVLRHPSFNPETDRYGNAAPGSMACVSLSVLGKVVGVLALFDKADGTFTPKDMELLNDFARPVATAVENARLYVEAERQHAAILATARTFSQPLIIVDETGKVVVANAVGQQLLQQYKEELFGGIRQKVGRTTESHLGDRTFLTTIDHLSGVGTIIIMQDITYVARLEKDRSEFMEVLSHDLRTPLNSILGWADLLQAEISAEERERCISNLTASSQRMITLIEKILQTVNESDSVQILEQSCDMSKIVQTVIQDVEGAARYKSISVGWNPSGEPYKISADETRLYHMVLNLVDNAIKYSPVGAQVDIQLDYSEFLLTLTVADEGPGIPEAEIPNVFDRFYRGEQAKSHPGSGLGLSAVKVIVDAHGGRVEVANRPDRGAIFSVKLPGSLRLAEEG